VATHLRHARWVIYLYIGAPLRLPESLSDQFPVRVCACPLCMINRLCMFISVFDGVNPGVCGCVTATSAMGYVFKLISLTLRNT